MNHRQEEVIQKNTKAALFPMKLNTFFTTLTEQIYNCRRNRTHVVHHHNFLNAIIQWIQEIRDILAVLSQETYGNILAAAPPRSQSGSLESQDYLNVVRPPIRAELEEEIRHIHGHNMTRFISSFYERIKASSDINRANYKSSIFLNIRGFRVPWHVR